MAVTSTPIFLQTPKTYIKQILPADTTTKLTLATAGANGSKIDAINISSTDTAARDLFLYVNDGSTDAPLGVMSIPANSGNTNALAAIDALNHAQIPGLAVDSNGNKCLILQATYTLKISSGATVTAAKAITATAFGGDF